MYSSLFSHRVLALRGVNSSTSDAEQHAHTLFACVRAANTTSVLYKKEKPVTLNSLADNTARDRHQKYCQQASSTGA